MGQAMTRWVWLPAPVLTRQATFKTHYGDLQQHPLPLRSAQWYVFKAQHWSGIHSAVLAPEQQAAFVALAAQAVGPGQAAIQAAPQHPVMTRGTTICFNR
ncbi:MULTISPECIES: hypothetical protein [Lactiplantibacillus]|uniref:Uncharacterized protein n=1 Tax=Lactiplantibacillus pentosus TaxID=1589 RepID=A0ABD7IU84_LACPE|nr:MULTISPECIES: hypothetical protein [Lactiplantibacillus]MCM8607756.1 hypothetical protein [Lactiplantibacillus sp. B652]PRO91323.1 hypothetical protein C6Y08_14520 [Lactiplantibacillus pentosus]RMW50618.1 hypothetical protein D6U18_03245 [Lactiplantibacillus pentosus]USJ87734.1 hypothetical protein KSF55_07970 [Lactiplantibacillus pentosus]